MTRAETPGRPALHAFEVDRAGRGPLLVFWDHRDTFAGEDEPPVTITDAFGQTQTIGTQNSQIQLAVSLTPLFIA